MLDLSLTHSKGPWCWERAKAGGRGADRGWDGWTASPTRWTWVWASSRSWWWTGRPGVLQSMGSQRAGHDWGTRSCPGTYILGTRMYLGTSLGTEEMMIVVMIPLVKAEARAAWGKKWDIRLVKRHLEARSEAKVTWDKKDFHATLKLFPRILQKYTFGNFRWKTL